MKSPVAHCLISLPCVILTFYIAYRLSLPLPVPRQIYPRVVSFLVLFWIVIIPH